MIAAIFFMTAPVVLQRLQEKAYACAAPFSPLFSSRWRNHRRERRRRGVSGAGLALAGLNRDGDGFVARRGENVHGRRVRLRRCGRFPQFGETRFHFVREFRRERALIAHARRESGDTH
jgi:hypothetical protein